MNDEISPESNPYAAPTGFERHMAEDQDSDESYMRAFIGPRADYYIARWQAHQQGGSAGFNIAAFFLSMFWMGYRKMYLVALIFASAIMGLTAIEEVAIMMFAAQPPPAFDLAINIAIAVTVGNLANKWYVKHCEKHVQRVRAEGLSGAAAKQKLRRRGGTSILAALGVIPILLLFSIVVFAIIDIAINGPMEIPQ